MQSVPRHPCSQSHDIHPIIHPIMQPSFTLSCNHHSPYHATIMHTILTFFILTTSHLREIHLNNYIILLLRYRSCNELSLMYWVINYIILITRHPQPLRYSQSRDIHAISPETSMQLVPRHPQPLRYSQSRDIHATIIKQSVTRHTRTHKLIITSHMLFQLLFRKIDFFSFTFFILYTTYD